MILKTGTTILNGKYRIDGVLGMGGMATVYQVTHLDFGGTFAIKRLHPEIALDQKMRERLLQEGKVAALLHSGAVHIFDWRSDDDGTPVLLMELLDGVSVDALGPDINKPIPLRESLCIAYLLLDVLRAAHEQGIVHRDIKPANLFVLRGGSLKVLDFGISHLRGSASKRAATTTGGTLLGTPAFMAPEQARRDTDEVDPRTDLFGVGATLFTMISGEYLHPGDGAHEVLARARSEPARSLTSVAPQVPQPIVDLVARAVAFEKAERWPSAAAMQEAVLTAHEALFGSLEPAGLAMLVEQVAERPLGVERSPEPSCRTLPSGGVSRPRGLTKVGTDTTAPDRAEDSERSSRPSTLHATRPWPPAHLAEFAELGLEVPVHPAFAVPLAAAKAGRAWAALHWGLLMVMLGAGLFGVARLGHSPPLMSVRHFAQYRPRAVDVVFTGTRLPPPPISNATRAQVPARSRRPVIKVVSFPQIATNLK